MEIGRRRAETGSVEPTSSERRAVSKTGTGEVLSENTVERAKRCPRLRNFVRTQNIKHMLVRGKPVEWDDDRTDETRT